ncbi:hypothetical protein FRC04_008130 [Tulasnella sp. 424]|nr:hypothetical protein FRC04_008130 [Tulasnella sp. 424]KAG8974787.1 hypothetical protein FRC05_006948 [Tulasnella sp. 425]
MSAANLTPEQQKVLSIIQLFENTGGSAAYLKHLEEARNSTTENVAQIDKNRDGLIESSCDITIKPADFAPDHFVIKVVTTGGPPGAPVYEGEGWGHAPGFKTTSFSGILTLLAPPGWDGLVKAEHVTFKGVKAPVGYMDWQVDMPGKQGVMNFGGQAPLDPALVGRGGPMNWKQILP